MSPWTSNSTMSSSSLFLALVLTIVGTTLLMHSGCNAATATARRPTRPTPPTISSVKEMRVTVAQFTQRLQSIEKSLAPLRASKTDLDRQFNSYSSRTARHGWQSAKQQLAIAKQLRQDAGKFQTDIVTVGRLMQNQYGPALSFLQSPPLSRFARDGPTKKQLAQSAKIYKRILELLENMIECPLNILQFLGEDSTDDVGDDMPSENSEPVYGEGAGGDYGYDY